MVRPAVLVLGALCALPGLGHAQSLGAAEGLPVASVRYDPDEPERQAQVESGLPLGAPLTTAAVRRAIRAIWSLHRYSDVRVIVEPTADRRVHVVIRTA